MPAKLGMNGLHTQSECVVCASCLAGNVYNAQGVPPWRGPIGLCSAYSFIHPVTCRLA